MNKQRHYFQQLVEVIRKYRGYVEGKLIFLAFSAVFGILVPYTSYSWFVVFLTLLLIGFIILRHHLSLVILSILTLFSFMYLFILTDSNNHTKLPPATTEIHAEIIETPDINGDKLSVIVSTAEDEKVLLVYYIETQAEKHHLGSVFTIGQICTFEGSLKEPQIARNPHSFSYKSFLYTKNIHWIFTTNSISQDNCISGGKWSVNRLLLNIREAGIEHIDSHFKGSNAGIIQALIYGERTNVESEITNSYQSLGLIHLLAISGLHVSLMTGMVYFLCIRFGMTRESTAILLLCLLPAYILIAGGSPSVIRSVTMTMLLLASIMWWKKSSMLDVISFACLCMLAVNPYFLVNIGFQLSFIVSASLILSSRAIFNQYSNALASLFVVSLLSQIASLPIILFHFYEFSLLSLPLNMIFVPLYSIVVLPFALLTVILLVVFAPAGQLLAVLLSWLLEMLNRATVWVSDSSFSVLTLGKPGFILMLLYCGFIFYFLVSWEKKKSIRQKAILAPLFVLFFHFILPYINPYGEVTMLDVGQGDSIFIELPYRKGVYLIDTGGILQFNQDEWRKRRKEFSTADIIIPFLKSRGVRSLDKLIITHGDQDHIGGAEGLIETIKVNEIVLGVSKKDTPQEAKLKKLAIIKGIHITEVKRGQKWQDSNYIFHVLAPKGNEMKENENSIILFTELGGLRWLFTGDTETSGEADLVRTYKNLRADVLKVGHHGSHTSSTNNFIQLLNPTFALIPVGENNRFNHPHPTVITRFEEEDIKVFRTDKNGAIQYRFLKNSGTFKTIIP